jgi:hypothetical protein
LIRHDKVNAAVAQCFDAFCRSIHDRLFVDIETRVDEDWQARFALEGAKDVVVERIPGVDWKQPDPIVQTSVCREDCRNQ